MKIEIDFDDDTLEYWQNLARQTGTTLEDVLRDAMMDRLEELEDYLAVKDRLPDQSDTIPSDKVWELLGLDESADKR